MIRSLFISAMGYIFVYLNLITKSSFCYNVIDLVSSEAFHIISLLLLWFWNIVFAITACVAHRIVWVSRLFHLFFLSHTFQQYIHRSLLQLIHSTHLKQWCFLQILSYLTFRLLYLNFFKLIFIMRCCWDIHFNNRCSYLFDVFFFTMIILSVHW